MRAMRDNPGAAVEGRSTAINRRSALGKLLALPAAASTFGLVTIRWTSGSAPATTTPPPVFRGYVAGFQFHEGPALIERMREGDVVTLVREPQNRHDRHAIRIDYDGRKIGYVPRTVSEHVAWTLGERASAPGTISAISREAVPWRALRVSTG